MRAAKAYGHIRGFNFQPDWGATGIGIWLKFDAERYRELVRAGKRAFPGINALRIWLSFDAWCEDRAAYLQHAETAARIITEEGLAAMPVYFNGWYGIPHFGAFAASVLKHLSKREYEPYRSYLVESVRAVSGWNILMHDVSNEPYNNLLKVRSAIDQATDFLHEMADQVRKLDSRPITVGSQGMMLDEAKTLHDFDTLGPFVDVFSAHPYMATEARVEDLLRRAEVRDKPLIFTECVWGSDTDEGHVENIRKELTVFAKYGVGFMPHALCTSPVADLHPISGKDALTCLGIYMAFLDGDLNVRPGHEAFNQFCP